MTVQQQSEHDRAERYAAQYGDVALLAVLTGLVLSVATEWAWVVPLIAAAWCFHRYHYWTGRQRQAELSRPNPPEER